MAKISKAELAERERRFAAERARIAKQRALWDALPKVTAVYDLEIAMLDRAWILLDSAKCEEADAILEFLPEHSVTKLLGEFFDDL